MTSNAHPLHDLSIFGPVSKDQIWHWDAHVQTAPGGVPTYAGICAAQLGAKVGIVTTWATEDNALFETALSHDAITVQREPSTHTTTFVLRYPDPQMAERHLEVSALASPLPAAMRPSIAAHCIYLAPLMQNDMGLALIKKAASLGPLALDAQGFLRVQNGDCVDPCPWDEMDKALPYVHTLKVNAEEASYLSGFSEMERAAQYLLGHGVKEVVITQDDCGALIVTPHHCVDIPAYDAGDIVDTTGCGDTFFAAYLVHRRRSSHIRDAGVFAAACAAMKLRHWGPSTASWADVLAFQDTHAAVTHDED